MYFSILMFLKTKSRQTTQLVKAELDKISTIKFTEDDLKRAKAKLLQKIENAKNNTINFRLT